MTATSKTIPLQSFAPGWGDPEVLEKTLVGRRDLVDRLEELVIDGAGGNNKHQRLIIGVRGSGKTHVLRVLHNRIWKNEELKKRLLVVYLLEDELGVASFLDFVVRMLRAIIRWYPEEGGLAKELDALYDLPPQNMESFAVELLKKAIGSKDVLILMENLGMTFDKVQGFGKEGQQKLRDLIQSHPHFMIFATSQALVEGTRDRDFPFFGFFKAIHLKRLTSKEAIQFLQAIASARGDKEIEKFLKSPKGRARMRAIYAFTGGNHRLLVTFFHFLSAESKARLSETFIEALNPLKPYYQEQMRALSAQQQKIVQYLCLRRTPCSVKEIAKGCLAASNTISSQLKDLLDRNFLSKIPKGRESYYEVAEALFRICYEADLEQEGAPIKLFVDFLGNLYTAQELQFRCRGYRLLADTPGLAGSPLLCLCEANYYEKALSRYYPDMEQTEGSSSPSKLSVRTFFTDMRKASAYPEIIEFSKHFADLKDGFVLAAEADALAHQGDPEKAKEKAMAVLQGESENIDAHLVLAQIFAKEKGSRQHAIEHILAVEDLLGKHQELSGDIDYWKQLWKLNYVVGHDEMAKVAYTKYLQNDPFDEVSLWELAAVLFIKKEYNDLEKLLERLTSLNPDNPQYWILKAHTYFKLGNVDKVEISCWNALKLRPENLMFIVSLGNLLFEAGKNEESLKVLTEAAQWATKDTDMDALWLLADTYRRLKQFNEAKTICHRMLEIAPNDVQALSCLRFTLYEEGEYEDALEIAERIVSLDTNNTEAWGDKGFILQCLGRHKEAVAAYKERIKRNPSDPGPFAGIGFSLLSIDRGEEAAIYLSEGCRLSPQDFLCWAQLAICYVHLGKLDDAEKAYKKLLEINPLDARVWIGGYSAVLDELGKHEEAQKVFFAALNDTREDTEVYQDRAIRRLQFKRYAEAIADLEESLRLDAKNYSAQLSLVEANLAAGSTAKAFQYLPSALEGLKNANREKATLKVVPFDGITFNLFEGTSLGDLSKYFTLYVMTLLEHGFYNEFLETLPIAIFAILRRFKSFNEERCVAIVQALEGIHGEKLDTRIPVLFLQVGFDYFKKKDDKALLRLTREERQIFCKELGIEDPGASTQTSG
ncbi:MAG: tetratricopeptide repeat protein [Myxococcales bacterium]|nr:MAG: tetratricopeptide repeat protein [Myxococcales bacterium]